MKATDSMNDNRLLIVDDDQDTCANMSDILTNCGYSVDVACDERGGLDLLKLYPYRLALLDLNMPDTTGVELFQRMRQLHQGIEGVLVTAFSSTKTTNEALAAGFKQVVEKPVEISTLLRVIEQALA